MKTLIGTVDWGGRFAGENAGWKRWCRLGVPSGGSTRTWGEAGGAGAGRSEGWLPGGRRRGLQASQRALQGSVEGF